MEEGEFSEAREDLAAWMQTKQRGGMELFHVAFVLGLVGA